MISDIDLARERINILYVREMPYHYECDSRGGNLYKMDVKCQYAVHYEFQYKPIDSPHTWYKGVLILESLYDLYGVVYNLVNKLRADLEE